MSVEEIKKLTNKSLTGKNIKIMELLELARGKDVKIAHSAIVALNLIFQNNAQEFNAEILAYLEILKSYFGHFDLRLRKISFEKSIAMLKIQSEERQEFQNQVFSGICEKIISVKIDEHFMETVSGALKYNDVRYFFYKNVAKLVKSDHTKTVFNILRRIEPRMGGPQLCQIEEIENKTLKSMAPAQFTKIYSECWAKFLSMPLPVKIYMPVLEMLHESILPNMSKPVLLMDFLVDAYNTGGYVSILALNGLFTLINEHNLDYPQFFAKLYALFDCNILHVKYRERFFRLAELFLRSTYIPAYLVASFLKRSAGLCLMAPPDGIVIILSMIYNLMRVHPSCIVLIHREDNKIIANDPYDSTCLDPNESRAIESCLWEISLLKRHYSPMVSELANLFEQSLAKPSLDFNIFVSQTYETMINDEFHKNGEPALCVQEPQVFSSAFQ